MREGIGHGTMQPENDKEKGNDIRSIIGSRKPTTGDINIASRATNINTYKRKGGHRNMIGIRY